MSLTGTVDAANARIDFHVDFTDQTGTQTFATLYRRVGSATADTEYARGLFGTTLLGEQAYVSDHEAPLDVPVWYIAVGGGTDTVSMTAGPFTIPSSGYVWMKDPGRPWADLRLDLCQDPDNGQDPCPVAAAVSDTFTRTVASSWGTADTGQVWSQSGGSAADFSVSTGMGRHAVTSSASGSRRSFVTAPAANTELYAETSINTAPVAAPTVSGLVVRYADVDNLYLLRLEWRTDNTVRVAIRRRVTATETELAAVVPAISYTVGDRFAMRFRITGSLMQAKVWPLRDSGAEPPDWQVKANDQALIAAGSVGTRSNIDSPSTATTTVVAYDNFQASTVTTEEPELAWVGLQDKTRAADAGLFDVLDAERPADVYARRKDITTSWLFLSRTRETIDRVYDLYTVGGPLLLQLPQIYAMNVPYGQRDRYFQPGDLRESYLSSDQRRPVRLWSAPVTAVESPIGQPQGTDTANWCALAETYNTYAEFLSAGFNWGQVAAGQAATPPTSTLYGGGTYGGGTYGG